MKKSRLIIVVVLVVLVIVAAGMYVSKNFSEPKINELENRSSTDFESLYESIEPDSALQQVKKDMTKEEVDAVLNVESTDLGHTSGGLAIYSYSLEGYNVFMFFTPDGLLEQLSVTVE